jgi:hypothetical protein
VSSERRLLSEVTALALQLHWPLGELLDLEHAQRQWFLREVASQSGAAAEAPW